MMRTILILLMPVWAFALVGNVLVDKIDLSNFPEISVSFRLYDPYGILDPSLKEDDVKVFENGIELDFKLERNFEKLEMIVAVDVSGSMKDILPKLKMFLRNFLRSFSRYDVEIVLADFGYEKEGGIEFHPPIDIKSPDGLRRIFEMLDSMKSGGATPLFDAVKRSIDHILKSGRRGVVVVFTDGYDMNYDDSGPGSAISLLEVLEILKASKVKVYTVGVAGKYYDPPLNEEVLEKLASGAYIRPEEGWMEDLMRELSKGLGILYKMTFKSKGGTKAKIIIEKPVFESSETYTASFTIEYPHTIHLPGGYRGVLKVDLLRGEILEEKDLGCFVEKISKIDGEVYAMCPEKVIVLDNVLNVLKVIKLSGVKEIQKVDGEIFFWRRSGLEGYLKGILTSVKTFGSEAYAYVSSKEEIVRFDGKKVEKIMDWKGKVVNFAKIGEKIYFVDYGSGVYEVDKKGAKLVVKSAGVTAYSDDVYTNAMNGEVVFGGRRMRIPFFPVDVMSFNGSFVVLGWLGEIALFDSEGNLKLFVPAKVRPRLKVLNGKDWVIVGGLVYRFEGESLKREDYDFEVYDLDRSKGLIIALGDRTIMDGKILDFPSERIGVWNGKIFLHSGTRIEILNEERFEIGRELSWINVSKNGVCVPTSEGVLVFKGEKPIFLKTGWVKDCAVSDEVLYTLDEYLNFLNMNGETIHRVVIPSSAFKVLAFKGRPYVLSLDGRLYTVKNGLPIVAMERCVDVHASDEELHVLTMEDGKLKVKIIH